MKDNCQLKDLPQALALGDILGGHTFPNIVKMTLASSVLRHAISFWR